MANLNNGNFWDKAKELYPLAVKNFNDWIDQYKTQVEWLDLFNSNSDYQNMHGKNAIAPKFHDIPLEMQIGILIAWIEQTKSNIPGFNYSGVYVIQNGISVYHVSISLRIILNNLNSLLK